ncbi:serine hydrolase domain-containing protein [Actinoplanes sp. NBRC 101535]|uniref:serine hydrolase domain-containing protein n=1 Tax=Actinoplanes sp. NBRC 101535 TaxID=3032196 RepID=UPI0024A45C0A|nr:serine hydrolase domain-containing protein [Actinoplanes sp. NBRC 101535]GLY03760.1 hypothetical protein Acsp01_41390 [Actinoplanes sp. NBRC 101535]
MIAQEWARELERLDRNVSSGRLSPDTATLAELMGVYAVPGVSFAVGDLSGEVWATGFGTAGTGRPVTAETGFAACSISKHVTAFGALRLVQQGVLDLDGDIGGHLTSWRLRDRAGRPAYATVRQLLAHTAGLSDTWYRGYPADQMPTLLQVLDGSGPVTTPPVRATMLPGSRFRYSGSHYTVLEQLMVDATGTSFEELMRTLVLEPLAMSGSSFDQGFPHRRPDLVAHGHHGGGVPVPGGRRTQPEKAAAGLWSTPADLIRLDLEIARAVAGESTLLDRELADQMRTPAIPGGGYGLGTETGERWGHTGQNVGYTCFSYVWPDRGIAVAVMTNSEDGWEVLAAVRAAADRLYAVTPVDGGTATAGRYFLRDDYPVDITVTDDGVTFAAPGQRPVVLTSTPDGYHHPGLDLAIRFPGPGIVELRQEGTVQTAASRP